MNLLMMPTLHVGQGTNLGGLSVVTVMRRSNYHEIRGLGWEDHLLHATVFNRRHHLMEVA